jgi:hypothetical protein
LQGRNKKETSAEFGDAQVRQWRRSYATPPPALERGHDHDPAGDPRYRDVPAGALPLTECLADVVARVIPYWEDAIVPDLLTEGPRGGTVLVVAHGNSLRGLRKHIEGIGDGAIVDLEVPTGIPFRYHLADDLSVVASGYLGDPDAASHRARRRAGPRGTGPAPSHGVAGPGSEGVGTPFAGPDPDDLLDREDPHLPVTDLPGAGGVDDRRRHLFDLGVLDEDLEPDLRHELDLVLGTPVNLGVASLAPEALGLGQGQTVDPESLQSLLHLVELERLQHRYDQLHFEFLLGFVVVLSAAWFTGR